MKKHSFRHGAKGSYCEQEKIGSLHQSAFQDFLFLDGKLNWFLPEYEICSFIDHLSEHKQYI